ncbi:unnamed protein product [Clavelina lepadiformis]|uniref:U6 snRNA-associated Sm-like protein LSm4 n=1 Tax=Clavelina lepadiformis TaxID=159417 RepID=A0ABP0GB16_CLALP
MLPLSLLKTAVNHPMLVELKNGETYNGHLVSCDNWMNINLREVICTSRVTALHMSTLPAFICFPKRLHKFRMVIIFGECQSAIFEEVQ